MSRVSGEPQTSLVVRESDTVLSDATQPSVMIFSRPSLPLTGSMPSIVSGRMRRPAQSNCSRVRPKMLASVVAV